MVRDDGLPCPRCGKRSPVYECVNGHIACRHCAHGCLGGAPDWDAPPTCPECSEETNLRRD